MTSKEAFELLEILRGLFVARNEHDVPYYSLDGKICVDTSMTATEEEIRKVKEWIE